MKRISLIILLLTLTSCMDMKITKGDKKSSTSPSLISGASTSEIASSEIQQLNQALQDNPEYNLSTQEIEMLFSEGLISESKKSELLSLVK